MDGSVLEEKSSFKMLGFTFSSKLVWSSYIISIAKAVSKKIVVLICSMKFSSPEVALYLYKSTIRPCMEYCCHVWASAPSWSLELLEKLQKQICRPIGPSLAASLEPLFYFRNVASLSLLYRYYFGRCSSELAQLVQLPYSQWTMFLSPFLDVTKMSMSAVSWLTQLVNFWNSLPVECFPLTDDYSGFKSTINRHLSKMLKLMTYILLSRGHVEPSCCKV